MFVGIFPYWLLGRCTLFMDMCFCSMGLVTSGEYEGCWMVVCTDIEPVGMPLRRTGLGMCCRHPSVLSENSSSLSWCLGCLSSVYLNLLREL